MPVKNGKVGKLVSITHENKNRAAYSFLSTRYFVDVVEHEKKNVTHMYDKLWYTQHHCISKPQLKWHIITIIARTRANV